MDEDNLIMLSALNHYLYCIRRCALIHIEQLWTENLYTAAGDTSSARSEGSMAVERVIWWKHNSKSGQYSSAKVHKTLSVNPDGSYVLTNFEDLIPEDIPGF
jgi:hypothetical protein